MNAEIDIQPRAFPEAYHAFLPVLERLTEPMLRVLRGHLLSLEAIFPSVHSASQGAKGDFEGIGGLTLRGDINRIIQSELLLRSEVPLEFVRRVSEGEALYMETEHSDPNEQVIYRVMISVGPYMLGHGRLLALASLIFLARAALARNAKLHWTYLPTEKTIYWFEGLSINNVKRFLKFASFRDVTDEDMNEATLQWEAFNTATSSGATDIESWLIGATGLSSSFGESQSPIDAAPNALLLNLDPPPHEGHQTANLDLQRQGRNIRRLRIDFPSDSTCVSALNKPFNPPKLNPQSDKDTGNSIPKIKGWAPPYILSPDIYTHVTRYQQARKGLLFLTIDKKQRATNRAVFFEMPEDANLAGVCFTSGHTAQILSQWNAPEETIFFHELKIRNAEITQRAKKEITSKHLFSKQQKSTVPPMNDHWHMVKSYTTLGQPFEFTGIRDHKTAINILYKENRVVYADAKYAVVIFDPSKKTSQEMLAWSKHDSIDEQNPSLVVLKDHSKFIDAYPCPEGLDAHSFRAMFYTPSSHCLTYSLSPGRWKVMGRKADQIDIILAPYERLIRCHMSHERCKMVVFSDPKLGGENTLKSMTSVNGEITGYDTLYKFDALASQLGQQNLTELKPLMNGGLRAVNLDEDGDPDKLIILQKDSGQYKPTIIDLEAELASCEVVNFET